MVANIQNLQLAFNQCNMKYFEGKLPIPQFDLLHSFRTCGYFNCDYEQGWFSRTLYNFRISMTDYYDFTPRQFEDIRPIAQFAGCDSLQRPIPTGILSDSNVSEYNSTFENAQ